MSDKKRIQRNVNRQRKVTFEKSGVRGGVGGGRVGGGVEGERQWITSTIFFFSVTG